MENLTREQLIELLEKAHRVIQASVRIMHDPDDQRDWIEYDSAYLAYDAARDVLREFNKK